MAPGAKRKRGDRSYSQEGSDNPNRPSPHRPQNLNMAHQVHSHNNNNNNHSPGNNRGGRRSSRGGRGNQQNNIPRSPISGPASQGSPIKANSTTSQSMMPPPSMPVFPRPVQQAVPVSTPIPKVQTEQIPAQPPALKAQLPDFFYEYITEERRNTWRDNGRKAVVDLGIQELSEDSLSVVLAVIFEELIRASLDGTLDIRDAGLVVREILESKTGEDYTDSASLFLDALFLMTETIKMSPPLYIPLKTLVATTNIPADLMRTTLEANLLMGLDLVRSNFLKNGIRKTTTVLYRQAAFNLLREESEGYSKLMTEYFTTATSEEPSSTGVADTFQRVKALIGAFDLDVGRVLDLTLDVFANMLVKYNSFFIKFLRISSWWPVEQIYEGVEFEYQGFDALSFWSLPPNCDAKQAMQNMASLKLKRDQEFWSHVRKTGLQAWMEIGARRITKATPEALEFDPNLVSIKGPSEHRDRQWMKEVGTLPPAGNTTAAQLLGFKLRFYASAARGEHDSLPDNLIYLAALLIKIGFISLRDLFPHLYPQESDMPALKEKLLKEKAERERKNKPGAGASSNALAMAGALSDDTVLPAVSRLREAETRAGSTKPEDKAGTPGKIDEPEQEQLPEPIDQKVHLLKSLLCIGCIPEALFILGKYPWFMDVYPELPEYVHRILHRSLSKVHDEIEPKLDGPGIAGIKKPIAESTGVPKSRLRTTEVPPRKSLRWAQLEKSDAGDGVDYRFYWEEWSDNVPICQNIDDVFSLCDTFMNISGLRIGQDPSLLMKLARIGRHSLTSDSSESNSARWIYLCKRLLVPSLSLTKGNPGVINDVFDLLKMFDTKTRYNIYAEWYTGATSRLPELKVAFDQAKAETKDVLKRISKTNTKQMARVLSKVAYGSPGIVFQVALNQMESYENLIEVVVECARYFTYLAYDVLTWSLMSSLGGRGRDRVQSDGMLTSSWLRALSQFAGKVFKRYSVMSVTPVLQYVNYQLLCGNSTDLEVLEQILLSMAGVRPDINLNDAQTNAMAGGELLQTLTLEQVLDKRHESRATSKRLVKALVDPGLAAQLLISIGQERKYHVFRHVGDVPLKVLGSNLDQLHHVFIQYLDVLRTNLAPKDFNNAIPDTASLIKDFGLEFDIAFTINRASIVYAMSEYDAEVKKNEQLLKDAKADSDRDVEMTDAVEQDQKDSSQQDTEMQDVTTTNSNGPWHPVLSKLMDDLQRALPHNFEDTMSLSFYTTFWQLGPSDVHSPIDAYDAEIKRQKEKIGAINADRSDLSPAGLKKKDEKRKALTDVQDRLRSEMKGHFSSYVDTRKLRLTKEKDHWFSNFPIKDSDALHRRILQDCILPRVKLSPLDALYAFKMIMTIHALATPGFRTLQLFDILLDGNLLVNTIFQCSARESENLGRFLNEMFKTLGEWHADSTKYTKEAHGKDKDRPGFAKRWKPDRSIESFIEYEDFRRVLYKWHDKLRQALQICFKSDEYMHIRNAITILKAVHQTSPPVQFMGKALLDCVKDLSSKETRGDLKLAATSLFADLRRREKFWVLPQAYKLVEPSAGSKDRIESRGGSARPGTPQPAFGLSASAQEFKPKTLPMNGLGSKGTGHREVEDGEIEDQKNKIAKASQVVDETASSAPAIEAIPNDKDPNINANSADKMAATDADPSSNASLDKGDNRGTIDNKHASYKMDIDSASDYVLLARTPHALPSRPEIQLPRMRPGERPTDRNPELHGHNRHEARGPPNPEYGRLERPGDFRENYNDRREPSLARRGRSRSPERTNAMDRHPRERDPGWTGPPRDNRPPYPEEKFPRVPQRERPSGRGADWHEGPRDRLAPDVRGRPPLPNDGRARLHGNPPMMPPPSNSFHGRDGGPIGPPAPPPQMDRPGDRLPSSDRSGMNPERAAAMEGDMRIRTDGYRSDRDIRRDRAPRPHSPRRGGDDRMPPAAFPSRADMPPRLDHRDDRGPLLDRPPHQDYALPRDRREDIPPTEPRGDRGRNDFADVPPHPPRSRELFQPNPSSKGPRDPNHGRLNQENFALPARPQAQDPNYGRLNANNDIPSGPRGRPTGRGGRNFTAPASTRLDASQIPLPPSPNEVHSANSFNDNRDLRNPSDFNRPPSSAGPRTPAAETAGELAGVHPSRLSQLQTPTLQTDFSGPPSGPRTLRPGPSNSTPTPTSATRNPPSGPSSAPDQRQKDNRLFGGLRGMMQQNGPPPPFERNGPERGQNARGRGGRSNGMGQQHQNSSPVVSNQPSTPMPSRPDGPFHPQPDNTRPDLMGNLRGGHGEHGNFQEDQSDSRPSRRGDRRDGEKKSRHREGRSRSAHRERERSNRDREDPKEKRERVGSDRERRESRRQDEPGREREGHRERERREGRPPREGGDVQQPRRGGPPTEESPNLPPPQWQGNNGMEGRTGEVMRRGGERRDDRERRDGRKRPRGAEEAGHENKRPRRSN